MQIELRNIDVDAKRLATLSGQVWRTVKPWFNKTQQAKISWSDLTVAVAGTKKQSTISRSRRKVVIGLPGGDRRNEGRFARTLTAALFWRAGCGDAWGRADRLKNPAGDCLFDGWDGLDGLPVMLLPKKEAAKTTKPTPSRMELTHDFALNAVVKREQTLTTLNGKALRLEGRIFRAEKALKKAKLKVTASKKRLDKKEASIAGGGDSRDLPKADFAERMKRRRAKED